MFIKKLALTTLCGGVRKNKIITYKMLRSYYKPDKYRLLTNWVIRLYIGQFM